MTIANGITHRFACRVGRVRLWLVIVVGFSSLLSGVAAFGQARTTTKAGAEIYWPTAGWRTASPEAQGMASEQLAAALDYVAHHRVPIHNLLIVRNGYVVLDASFYPFQAGQLHDGASMTKSITSTLIGIAIGQHKLAGINQPIMSLFPQPTIAHRDQQKEKITIGNLLTMTSGLDCRFRSGEITLREMAQSKDWVQFMLDLPMANEPGSKFEYCSGGMHLLSGIISNAMGTNALEFARRELFQPLGIRQVVWPSDPKGVTYGWGDLHLQPRDWAKIGYLWLNGGRWDQRQIIPADWIQAATQEHSRASWGDQYGYGIWVYPNREPSMYEANGRGGQRVTVVPALNLVVVFTGGQFEPGDIGKFILQSIKSDQPLPENPSGARQLSQAIDEAARPPKRQGIAQQAVTARSISGKTYQLEGNPLGLKSLSVTFAKDSEAVIRLEFMDGRTEERPVGLDGVPRISTGGRFGLPVALTGAWQGNDTFALNYDEIANINLYRFRLTFSGHSVSVGLKEDTGLVDAEFNGRQ